MTSLVTSLFVVMTVAGSPTDAAKWWDAQVDTSLNRAPERKAEWVRLLEKSQGEQRAGLAYLISYLPLNDLKTLPPKTLADNLALAYQARAEVPWGRGLPDDVFLDAVLPHASVTEPRDSMRAEFHTRYLPLVVDCKTPGQAALAINKKLFADFKVGYNTRRLRTDQSSKESIAQGMATCTGLSIMLVEACRSVAVPARLTGIASWPGRGGNHTWVEVWDNGWHFVGAAEPDDKGLDHAWFVGDASKAIKGASKNAIYAVTYRLTGDFFPLVWAPSAKMPGEDVTDRYARGAPHTPARSRLMVEVRRGGDRVEAEVTTLDRQTGASRQIGSSLGPAADINRHLTCEAPAGGGPLFIVARHDGRAAILAANVAGTSDTIVRVDLDRPVPDATRAELGRLLADRFGNDETKKAAATKILAEVPWVESLRELAWSAYKASPSHEPLRREFDAKTVATKDRKSPYLWRHVGQKPADGWGLVIAMHGGGNAPASLNDEQWRKMFRRYKDHAEAGGYVYLSLRAPNDTWNGFYDDAICPLVERLIRQFVVLGDVNPDKIFTLGASHGGYGAFVIGPKMPDRFAAIHASASAPTPGETLGVNLRNVRFTFMVGERDTDYGRAERCLEFEQQIQAWRKSFGGFPGHFEWEPGIGHQVPDLDKLAEMLKGGVRKPYPSRIVWAQSDDVIKHFYWIEAPHPNDSGRIEATAKDNAIALKADHQNEVILWLDTPLVNLASPVTVSKPNGQVLTITPRPNLETYCFGLEERGDPRLAAPLRVTVDLLDLAEFKTVETAEIASSPDVLKRPRTLRPAYLGISLDPETRQSLAIGAVDADSPAARAGVASGDLLRTLDGRDVKESETLRTILQGKSPGDLLKVGLRRGDRPVDLTLTLASWSRPLSGPGSIANPLGVRVKETKDNHGVTIERVSPGSPADRAKLKVGETILKVGSETLTGPDQFDRLIVDKKPGETLPLTLFLAEKALEMKISLNPEPRSGQRLGGPGLRMASWTKPTFRLALICVEYPDVKHNPKITRDAWDFSLFSRGASHKTSATGQPDHGSMFDYYLEQSYGKFKLEGKVFDWVEVSKKRADYATGNRTRLLTEALDKLIARDGKDALKGFDGIFFLYAGARFPAARGSLYWAHRASVSHGGRRWPYFICDEGGTRMQGISVFCHEFGHMLGLPDLYAQPENPGMEGAGVWCAMSQQSRLRPQHFCAWSKEKMGWVMPAVINPAVKQKLVLAPIEDSPKECFKVLIRPDGSEYLLLENRKKKGFDESLPAEGLLIWRVVANRPVLQESHGVEGPSGPNLFRNDVPYPSAANDAYTPYTTPSSRSAHDDGYPVHITNIRRQSDGRITFEIGYEYE